MRCFVLGRNSLTQKTCTPGRTIL